jgi:hypothetical protein
LKIEYYFSVDFTYQVISGGYIKGSNIMGCKMHTKASGKRRQGSLLTLPSLMQKPMQLCLLHREVSLITHAIIERKI